MLPHGRASLFFVDTTVRPIKVNIGATLNQASNQTSSPDHLHQML